MNNNMSFGGHEPSQPTEPTQETISPLENQEQLTPSEKERRIEKKYIQREAIEWMLANRDKAEKEIYGRKLQTILDEIIHLGGSEEGFLAYKKNKVLH